MHWGKKNDNIIMQGGNAMENVKDRIKLVRKHYKLNQTDFGNKIGLSQTTIGQYETGVRTLTERSAADISRVYKVDYLWLTTGEGEPFPKNDDEDIMTQLEIIMAGESDTHKNLIKSLVNCSEEELQAIEKFIDVIKRS